MPKHRCDKLVYKINVQNTLEEPILVKIVMTAKNPQTPINISWPRTGMVGKVSGGSSQMLGLLCRIDPTDDNPIEHEKLDF